MMERLFKLRFQLKLNFERKNMNYTNCEAKSLATTVKMMSRLNWFH